MNATTKRRMHYSLPLLAKELIELANRRQTYGVRSLFAIVLGGICLSRLDAFSEWSPAGSFPLLGQGSRFLTTLFLVEWWGLCLIIPAGVSGAIVAEKERNTLSLIFLTRLGPWAIVLEKLLSRMVPVATFLLMSLPMLCVAYSLGGLTPDELLAAVNCLLITAFEVGAIAIFCSAFCCTTSGALVLTYFLEILVFLGPMVAGMGIDQVWGTASPGGVPAFRAASGGFSTGIRATPTSPFLFEALPNICAPVELGWFFPSGRPVPASSQPFPLDISRLLGPLAAGLLFLLLARLAVVRRAAAKPRDRVRQLFLRLDQVLRRANERFAGGVVVIRERGDLALDRPVAWREARRGNLGRLNYLVRIMLAIEIPLWFCLGALLTMNFEQPQLGKLNLVFWGLAVLTVSVRSAGLIAAERTRETLNVLLTTPIPLRSLVNEKLAGVRRVMVVMSIPLLTVTLFRLWWHGQLIYALHFPRWNDPDWKQHAPDVYLWCVILAILVHLHLVSRVAFLIGLRSRTQVRAVLVTFGCLLGWIAIPIFLIPLASVLGFVNEMKDANFLAALSPLVLLSWNEEQTLFGGNWNGAQLLILHYGFWITVYFALVWVTPWIAGAPLVRPSRSDRLRARPG